MPHFATTQAKVPRQNATSFAPMKGESLQRKCASGGAAGSRGECARTRDSNTDHSAEIPQIVHEVLNSPGKPLDPATRAFMEPRFGHDFGHVRVHTDARAAESARAVHAHAYTVGQDVVFGTNQFAPTTHKGRELLAHELAHTIQQRNAGGASASADRNDIFEGSANAAARSVADGGNVSRSLPACGTSLARSQKDDDEQKRRAAAIAEAEAVAAQITKEQEEDEAEAKAEREERETPVSYRPKTLSLLKPDKTPSKFSPGGFTDEEANKVYKEAEDRMKLGELALTLAERQARRREFWEGNPSYNSADVKKAFDLDLYWDPEQEEFIRQPYVSKYEDLVNADPEAKRLYDSRYWDLTENKPEKKSLIRRILDPPVHFICNHTEPCTGIIEQMHKDKEGGMSDEEALKRGLTRLTLEGAMFALPGKGPSGPIAIGPGRTPSGMPFDTPAFETGAIGASDSNVAPTAQATKPSPAGERAPTPKPMPTTTTGDPAATAPSKPAVTDPTVVPDAPPKTTTPKIVPSPKPKVAPKATVSPKDKPLTPLPSGDPRGTIRATPGGYKTTKTSQPEVIVRRTTGRTPDPAASFDPYQPSKTNVAGEYRFRQFEKGGKSYQQAEGRLGMPDEVQTHRDVTAQRKVSGGTGDDAGHLIGNRFGPPGSAENLGRQNWVANRVGNYHALEDAWAGLRRRGVQIDVQVTDVTRIGEDRPFMRNVQWTETAPDGSVKSYEVDFANTMTPQSRVKSGDSPTSGGGKVIEGGLS
jgi:hypothetical protein